MAHQKRLKLWPESCLIWETARPYLYIRTTSDKRVIVGGGDEEFSDPEHRDKLMDKKNKTILRKFKKLFPEIELEIDFSWLNILAKLDQHSMRRFGMNKTNQFIIGTFFRKIIQQLKTFFF